MRLLIVPVLALVAAPALALDMPARKPGLWELKMTMEGGRMPPRTFQHCIDAVTDKGALPDPGDNESCTIGACGALAPGVYDAAADM